MVYKVSVIIPACNKQLELELLLYTLALQAFNLDQMEVVVVDDASTDGTEKLLQSYSPPYPFRYLRNETRRGRSFTRNRGFEAAQGTIIIFLDGEMLVPRHFVRKHVEQHQSRTDLVLTGAMHLKGVYTIFYPGFSDAAQRRLHRLVTKDRRLSEELMPRIEKGVHRQTRVPLLKKKQIQRDLHRKLSYSRPYFPEIVKKFGPNLTGYKLPWTSFVSCNVSVPKRLLEVCGGFDETFQGWGFEDWELGYRLYRCGAYFRADSSVSCYHQEHPVAKDQVIREMFSNYFHYQERHPCFEICIHAAFLLGCINRLQEHRLVEEYLRLLREVDQKKRHFFVEAMLRALRSTAWMLKQRYEREAIFSELKKDGRAAVFASAAVGQRDELERSGRFPGLVQMFDRLVL